MERAKGSVTGNVVLECRNVGRTFKGYNGGPDNEVLRGVDFEVRENEFLVLFGVGCALTTVAYPILTTALFGNRDYSSIYGIVNVANSVGTAVGSPIAAAIFDSQGSYVPAWYLAAALLCVDFVVLLVMFRKKPAAEAVH